MIKLGDLVFHNEWKRIPIRVTEIRDNKLTGTFKFEGRGFRAIRWPIEDFTK